MIWKIFYIGFVLKDTDIDVQNGLLQKDEHALVELAYELLIKLVSEDRWAKFKYIQTLTHLLKWAWICHSYMFYLAW